MAAPCPKPAGTPCTPDAAKKDELLSEMREVISQRSKVSEAERKWKTLGGGKDKEVELAAFEAFMKTLSVFERKSAEMIRDVESAYNAAPLVKRGTARKPVGGKMSWIEGMPAEWRPRLSFADDVYRRYKANDGSEHYGATNLAAYSGNTFPDGEALISAEVLAAAIQDKNPGVIGQVIFHEGRHFEKLTSTGWAHREEEELRAYSAVLANAGAFELSQDWEKVQRDSIEENREAIRNNRKSIFVVSPAEERQIKAIVEAQEKGQRGLEEYYQGLKEHVVLLRAQAEAERRQSDNRLRLALVDIVIRSCETPGSVDQSELDNLQNPHDPNFYIEADGRMPSGLGDCSTLFVELAWRLRDGESLDAVYLSARSRRAVPIPVNPGNPVVPIRPRPIVSPTPLRPTVPFASMLPSIKQLSSDACQSPDRVSTRYLMSSFDISFSPSDDPAINGYLMLLGSCERRVFEEIVARIRAGQGREIDAQWVRERGAANRVPPQNGGGAPSGPDHDEVWRRIRPVIPRR